METTADTPRPDGRVRRSRTRLDRDVVIDTAMAIADEEGLEALTIRRLAQALSVTPMALYWHFADKDALLAALADRLWDDIAETAGQMAAGDTGADPWAPLRHTMESVVRVLRGHPTLAGLVPMRVLESPSGLELTERTLAFLRGVGFGPRESAETAALALQSAIMLVGTVPGAGLDGMAADDLRRRKRLALASLSPERYPNVSASAYDLTACDEPDGFFGRGIDLVLAGARSLAPAPDGSSRE